jgi:hypothetical protein
MGGDNYLIPASILVDEVTYLGGSIVLLMNNEATTLRLTLPSSARWLRVEITQRKLEVIAELRRRYLRRVC